LSYGWNEEAGETSLDACLGAYQTIPGRSRLRNKVSDIGLNVWPEMSDISVRAGGQNVAQVGTLSYINIIHVLKQWKLRLCQFYLVKLRTVYSYISVLTKNVIFAG
jgi:hypothetical protein